MPPHGGWPCTYTGVILDIVMSATSSHKAHAGHEHASNRAACAMGCMGDQLRTS